MSRYALEACLAWMFVPPERAPAWEMNARGRSPHREVEQDWLRRRTGLTAQQALALREDAHRMRPWWTALSELAGEVIDTDGSDAEIDLVERKGLPAGLPLEVLAAFHTQSRPHPPLRPSVRLPVLPVGTTLPDTDHHVHLSACIPAATLWREVISRLLPLELRASSGDESGDLGSLVLEAVAIRWGLAESCLAADLGWRPFCERRGLRPSGRGFGALQRPDLGDFRAELTARVPTPGEPRGDVLDGVIGCAVGEAEWRILRAAVAAVRAPSSPIMFMLARYLQIRCAFERLLTLRDERVGLSAFADRFERSRRVTSLLGKEPEFRDSGARHRLRRWQAAEAGAALRRGGASRADLRVPLSDLPEAIADYRMGLGLAGVEARFVGQVHRARKATDEARGAAALIHRGGLDGLIAVDLVGPEMNNPPQAFAIVYEMTRPLRGCGLRWFVHVSEDPPWPLTGLRHISWCLERLDLREGDRLGHALALSSSRDAAPALVSANVLALDLAWLAHRLGHRPKGLEVLFDQARSHFGGGWSRWDAWERLARSNEAEPPSSSCSLPGTDGLVRLRPTADLVEALRQVRERLIADLTTRNVALEVCPTSNNATGGWDPSELPLREHPALPWLIGTDDPALLGASLTGELVALHGAIPGVIGRLSAASQASWP